MTQVLETRGSSEQDDQGNPKKTKILMQKGDIALSNPPGNQEKSQSEALIKKGHDTSLSTPNKPATNTARKQPSTEIGSPIKSLTPLHLSQGNLNVKVVFIEDLTLIVIEEIPP
jgi:hypothetical protein